MANLPVKADTVDVSIVNFAFIPDSIDIKFGTTVRWTNNSASLHTSTSDSGVWNSGNINPAAKYSFTFDSAGVFPYHCAIHPTMTAKVVVTRSIPALTPYGLIVLLGLVAGSALWVLRKRRIATVRR
jgi:plastocyanin